MCEHCDLIDYPVADIWRKCYVPPGKKERTPRHNHGQSHFEAVETLAVLQSIIASQKAEIGRIARENEALKSRPSNGADASHRSYEGIE